MPGTSIRPKPTFRMQIFQLIVPLFPKAIQPQGIPDLPRKSAAVTAAVKIPNRNRAATIAIGKYHPNISAIPVGTSANGTATANARRPRPFLENPYPSSDSRKILNDFSFAAPLTSNKAPTAIRANKFISHTHKGSNLGPCSTVFQRPSPGVDRSMWSWQ